MNTYPDYPLAPFAETGLVATCGDQNQSPARPVATEILAEALKTVYDPEIPVNIYDLGLIYDLTWEEDMTLACTMSLTTPACPVAGLLPQQVGEALSAALEGGKVEVYLTFEPAWTIDRMSDDAKLILGYE